MAYALNWDATGEKFYEAGVDHAVLYPMTAGGAYGNGVAWNGIVSVSENPSGGEANDLWADNIKYASLRSTETFGFTIEAYMAPDEFAACDGYATYGNGVGDVTRDFIKVGQQERRKFGFCYRTKIGNDSGVDEYQLHLIWGASATPSERQYQTINDSPDAITFSWECDTVPVPFTGDYTNLKPVSSMTVSSGAAPDIYAALEKILYGEAGDTGTVTTQPRFPTPNEVLDLLDEGE